MSSGGGRLRGFTTRCLGVRLESWRGNNAPEPRTGPAHHIILTVTARARDGLNAGKRTIGHPPTFVMGLYSVTVQSQIPGSLLASGPSRVCGLDPTLFRFLFPSCPSVYWISCVHAGTTTHELCCHHVVHRNLSAPRRLPECRWLFSLTRSKRSSRLQHSLLSESRRKGYRFPELPPVGTSSSQSSGCASSQGELSRHFPSHPSSLAARSPLT